MIACMNDWIIESEIEWIESYHHIIQPSDIDDIIPDNDDIIPDNDDTTRQIS